VPGHGGMINVQKLGNLLLGKFAGFPQLSQAIFKDLVRHKNLPSFYVYPSKSILPQNIPVCQVFS
jgi:hypothetical protein